MSPPLLTVPPYRRLDRMTEVGGRRRRREPAEARRRPRSRRHSGRESGTATLETVILVPALLLFGGLLIFAGRAALARQAVEQAAWDAAREASIARTPAEARAKATDRATALLTDLGCQPTVTVDTSAFALPVSQAASVTADVSCRVDLSQLTVPGLPGQIVLQATSSSSLDTYRGRR